MGAEVRGGKDAGFAAKLPSCGANKIRHFDAKSARIRGEEGCGTGGADNGSAGHVQPGQGFQIDVRIQWRGSGQRAFPDTQALRNAGFWEMNDHLKAANKSVVDLILDIAGENDETRGRFQALEQVTDFQIGVAIGAVLNFGALAEERFRFIEKEDAMTFFGFAEGRLQIFFRFRRPIWKRCGQGRL